MEQFAKGRVQGECHDRISNAPEMLIPPFNLLSTRRDGEVVVKVAGELDLATAPRLHDLLVDLAKQGPVQVTLDLAGLAFIDSTGLGVLVSGLKRLREKGGELALQSPNAAAMRLFELTGLNRVFAITRSE